MQEAEDQRYGVSRVVAFSDAVFAFAMTLLIITILPYADLPSSLSAEQFFQQLFSPRFIFIFISYALSFWLVGNYWVFHHRVFRYIIKFDARLLWINLTLLFFIAFLPFPTALFGQYGSTILIVAGFAATMSILSVLNVLLWWYASSHHRLILSNLEKKIITDLRLRAFTPIPFFVISIGLAFINPYLAPASWLAIFLVQSILLRKYVRER